MTTAEKLNKVADHIEGLPHALLSQDDEQTRVMNRMTDLMKSGEGTELEEFNVGIYTCGTAGCVAAHIVEVLGTLEQRNKMHDGYLDIRENALRLLADDNARVGFDYGWDMAQALFYGPDTDILNMKWMADMSAGEYEAELTPKRAAHAMRLYARGFKVRPWNIAIEELEE